MNRRVRVPLTVSLVGALLLGAGWMAFRRAPAPSRPDIVLLVWDTARADRTQVAGYARPTTPNLLRFAAGGRAFRRCFTPSPWTPPSHASLFTGLLPRNHGLGDAMGDRVRAGIPMLAETLRDAGYETVSVAANSYISDVTGLDRGFGRRIQCFESKVPGAAGMDVGDRVLEWLDGRPRDPGAKPFFLFVNMMETHVPYGFDPAEVTAVAGAGAVAGAREASARMLESVVMAHMSGVQRLDPGAFPAIGDAYDGAMRLADRSTGRILDRMQALGILDRAVVVVCGDHGENLGEHGALGHAHSLSENVLHVPLVVRWPGRFAPGTVEDAQVRLQDVYPTLLEAAGVPVPPTCGRDALPLTESPIRPRMAVATFGPSTDRARGLAHLAPNAPAAVVEQLFLAYGSVRLPPDGPGARKYVSVARTDLDGNPVEVREALYDLAADPGEDRNLLEGTPAPEERAAAARLRTLLGR